MPKNSHSAPHKLEEDADQILRFMASNRLLANRAKTGWQHCLNVSTAKFLKCLSNIFWSETLDSSSSTPLQNIVGIFVHIISNLKLKLKLNCLFWSFHLYIVNVKKRPTKPWRLIQHRLMPFYQVFGVLQDKRETLSIQIYAGFSRHSPPARMLW